MYACGHIPPANDSSSPGVNQSGPVRSDSGLSPTLDRVMLQFRPGSSGLVESLPPASELLVLVMMVAVMVTVITLR